MLDLKLQKIKSNCFAVVWRIWKLRSFEYNFFKNDHKKGFMGHRGCFFTDNHSYFSWMIFFKTVIAAGRISQFLLPL